MMRGHRAGCRCVGCSPATRAQGMRALGLRRRNPTRKMTPAGQRFVSKHIRRHVRKYGMPPARAARAAYEEARREGYKVPPALNPTRRFPGLGWYAVYDAGSPMVPLVVLFARQRPTVPRTTGSTVTGPFPTEPRAREWARKQYHRGNPLNRAETAWVLRGVHLNLILARRSARGGTSYVYHQGRADAGQDIAHRFGAAKTGVAPAAYLRRNPSLRVVGAIPGKLTEIRYRRAGRHPGNYRHPFGPGARILALSDGSLLIRGRQQLWKADRR